MSQGNHFTLRPLGRASPPHNHPCGLPACHPGRPPTPAGPATPPIRPTPVMPSCHRAPPAEAPASSRFSQPAAHVPASPAPASPRPRSPGPLPPRPPGTPPAGHETVPPLAFKPYFAKSPFLSYSGAISKHMLVLAKYQIRSICALLGTGRWFRILSHICQ